MPSMHVKVHRLRDRRVTADQRNQLLSTSFDEQQGSNHNSANPKSAQKTIDFK